jgi:hypothetical protein
VAIKEFPRFAAIPPAKRPFTTAINDACPAKIAQHVISRSSILVPAGIKIFPPANGNEPEKIH